jgi:hypothetical protein
MERCELMMGEHDGGTKQNHFSDVCCKVSALQLIGTRKSQRSAS